MNGFDPLGGLKEWHIWVTLLFSVFGIVGFVICVIKAIIWISNHIEFI